MGITYLDPRKQQLMEAIEIFKKRVEQGRVADFVILGINTEKAEMSGFFTMMNVGDRVNDINMILDMTKANLIENMLGAAMVYEGDEVGDYDDDEEEDTEAEEDTSEPEV